MNGSEELNQSLLAGDAVLETERLILRKLTPDDAQALYRLYHERTC